MASSIHAVSLSVTILLLFHPSYSIPLHDFDSILSILRARGYTLFPNAISTSDLQFHLLSAPPNASFTFFAPTDSSLFALDMTLTAPSYTNTLSYHLVPRRLSFSDLRGLPSGASLPTLLPSRSLSVTRRRRSSQHTAIFVGGIEVVLPELYRGRRVIVHGLGGIVTLTSPIDIVYSSDSPSPAPSVRSARSGRLRPRSDKDVARASSTKSPIRRKSPAAPATPRTSPAARQIIPPASPPIEVPGDYFHSQAPSPGNEGSDRSEVQSVQSPTQAPGTSPETSPISAPSPVIDEVSDGIPRAVRGWARTMAVEITEWHEKDKRKPNGKELAHHTSPVPDDLRVEDAVEKSCPGQCFD